MKIFKPLSPIAMLAVFLFMVAGCDVIEEPYLKDTNPNGDTTEVVQKFLLEEFTGHQCPNCPEGSKEADALKTFYGDKLVIVSIHAGWFANASGSTFNYDFTTPEGDELNSYFSIVQNPMGIVNRTEYEGTRLLGPSAWGSAMEELSENEPSFAIALKMANETDNNFTLTAETTALTDLSADHYLVAVITENGIISPQKVNDPVNYPQGYIPDYEHKYVLRKAITNIWGEKLSEQPIDDGEKITKMYDFDIDPEWVAENCNVVVYVMNQDLQVLQVEEVKLVE
ncbi:MAG: Omp28-related outer membrane protein [Bacteroidota bacterium]